MRNLDLAYQVEKAARKVGWGLEVRGWDVSKDVSMEIRDLNLFDSINQNKIFQKKHVEMRELG